MVTILKRENISDNFDISPLYTTKYGLVYTGDSKLLLSYLPNESIDLVLTSPPYALLKKKEYGNVDSSKYIKWFKPFANQIYRILKPEGSFVLNIGGAWNKGKPTRSLYPFELLISLVKNHKFYLAQEFFWYNPSKLPAPTQWVNIERCRVKDSVEYIWWLSKSQHPKASNLRILTDYSKAMKKLLKNQKYNHGKRPSGHIISEESWLKDKGGAIPPNVIGAVVEDGIQGNVIGVANTHSVDVFSKRCRKYETKLHPARFPEKIPQVFIEFLTEEKDWVLDPFAGSNTTGYVAERKNRNWLAFEKNEEYAKTSYLRFSDDLLDD